MMNCTVCKVELTGELDTYGDVGSELCIDCFYNLQDENPCQSHYGMAPHHHDMTITGDWVGSTILDALPEPADDGRYWIESRQQWFTPDYETDGEQGIWEDC